MSKNVTPRNILCIVAEVLLKFKKNIWYKARKKVVLFPEMDQVKNFLSPTARFH